jgi:hypothetical protein
MWVSTVIFRNQKGSAGKKSSENTQLTNEESTMSNNVQHLQSSDVHQSDYNRRKKKFFTGHSKNTKAKLDSTSHTLQGVATKLIEILIILHGRTKRCKHGGKSTSLLKQNKHCTHKENTLENNHSKKEQQQQHQQKRQLHVQCNTEKAFDLYILEPSQIVKPLNPVGSHTSCSQLQVCYKVYYYYYGLLLFINLLLYFFQEIIIHRPTLILSVLNLSVITSKFYPVEIFCDCWELRSSGFLRSE